MKKMLKAEYGMDAINEEEIWLNFWNTILILKFF